MTRKIVASSATNDSDTWDVYIIRTLSGKLYTGIARSCVVRFEEHLTNPKKAAKFFRSDPPDTIVYVEQMPNRSEALQREYAIKQLRRGQKLQLIANYSAG